MTYHPGQLVIIDTALGGVERANYKQPLAALPDTHEVWVGNRPSAARIVRTRQLREYLLPDDSM